MAHTSTPTVVRRSGTSWISVIGGWIASIGTAALLSPLVGGFVATRGGTPDDLALAVPAVLGVLLAYLVGGYVAGRMAGYSTSWHGLMTAFFGLFVVLAVILAGVAVERGYLGDVRIVMPAGLPAIGDAITFGAILGFLAAIFAGWLGGLLAPTRAVPVPASHVDHVTPVAPVTSASVVTGEERVVVRDPEPVPTRRSFRFLPAAGRKGGERVVRTQPIAADGEVAAPEAPVDPR